MATTTITIPAHLSDYDADLYVALYCERNRLPRDGVKRVRASVTDAPEPERIVHALRPLGIPT